MKKRDILLILVLFFLAGVSYFLIAISSYTGNRVIVTVDKKVVIDESLSENQELTVPLTNGENTIVIKDGQAETNTLKQVSDKDLRPLMAKQDYVKDAPLVLVYTGTDEKNSPLHAGSAYQNVGLYAASRGLNNVVRGYFDKDRLAKALNVKSDDVIVTQVLGWPYM